MFEMLDGKGTELGIINAIGWGIFLLAKAGAFRKMKVWIRIGGNGKVNNSRNNPGNPNGSTKIALARLDERIDNVIKVQDKSDERNREDHQLMFRKIDEVKDRIK